MDINVDLLQWFLKFLIKTSGSRIKNDNMSDQSPSDLSRVARASEHTRQLAEELHKQIIKKFKKRKVDSTLIDNIWGADILLRSKFDKGFRFLLWIIDTYSKYAWVVPLKDTKGNTITNTFQKILDKSKRKPKKIWVDKGIEFYNRSMKS